ncbi:hypothetical protein B0T20DRAFT_401432 [Sordaria brevicollis]|uniref:Uncharacterized protein n=1 Tax=Sordaria brevicollis TaxID=83679 RepID=A0AAE0UFA2_SORBR|nr:hypothetical protein B0T20DRAFT_401432 [Sordaria brevicollis]
MICILDHRGICFFFFAMFFWDFVLAVVFIFITDLMHLQKIAIREHAILSLCSKVVIIENLPTNIFYIISKV